MGAIRAGSVSATVRKPRCRCNCGYTCGGPGTCMVFSTDMQKCMSEHFKKDCDHAWDGPTVDTSSYGCTGSSASCAHCGMVAESHDMAVGP